MYNDDNNLNYNNELSNNINTQNNINNVQNVGMQDSVSQSVNIQNNINMQEMNNQNIPNMNVQQGISNVQNMNIQNNAPRKMSAKEHMNKLRRHGAMIDHHQKKVNAKLVLITLGVILLIFGIAGLALFLILGDEGSKHQHTEEYDEVEKIQSNEFKAGFLTLKKVEKYTYKKIEDSQDPSNSMLKVTNGVHTFYFYYNMLFPVDSIDIIFQNLANGLARDGYTIGNVVGKKLSNGRTLAYFTYKKVSESGFMFFTDVSGNYILLGDCSSENIEGAVNELPKLLNGLKVNTNPVGIQEDLDKVLDIIKKD